MEKAIYISGIEKIRLYGIDSYDRIYFGNEFCDTLIPSLNELKDVVSMVRERKKKFSFMTCFVSEYRMESVNLSIELLAKIAPDSEVIINDWGTLRACLRNKLTPVLGRLLVKQKRDPRITTFINSLPLQLQLRFKQTCLNSYFIDFLKTQNIKRAELDNLLQGLDAGELQDANFCYSIYLPYGYITTTRMCPTGNKNKFHIAPCTQQCRKRLTELRNGHMHKTLFLKGNTIFFKNDLQDFLKFNSRINRIVYEPDIPI